MFEDIDTPQTPYAGQIPPPRPRPIQPILQQNTVAFPEAPVRSAAPPPNLPTGEDAEQAEHLPTSPLPEDIFSPSDTIPIVSGESAAEPPVITPLGGSGERSPGAPMPPISLPEQDGGGFRKVIVFLLAALIVALLGVGAYLVYRIIKTRDNVDIVNQPIENGRRLAPLEENETETPENETTTPPISSEEEVPEEEGGEEEPTVLEEDEETEESETPPAPPTQTVDTDSDGLTDLEELEIGSNPRFVDTDMDGLDDYSEVRIYYSDPVRRDTDGDGYDDGFEVQNGYSPIGPGKLTSE